MSKVAPIGNGIHWGPKAVIANVLEELKEHEGAQLVIMFRKTENHEADFRASNVTNAEAGFLADEFKHSIVNRCHSCKCEENNNEG